MFLAFVGLLIVHFTFQEAISLKSTRIWSKLDSSYFYFFTFRIIMGGFLFINFILILESEGMNMKIPFTIFSFFWIYNFFKLFRAGRTLKK